MMEETAQDWYFTFGSGRTHAGRYVVLHGTFDETRKRMFELFGEKWCMQYKNAELAGVEMWGYKELICGGIPDRERQEKILMDFREKENAVLEMCNATTYEEPIFIICPLEDQGKFWVVLKDIENDIRIRLSNGDTYKEALIHADKKLRKISNTVFDTLLKERSE
ncbi:MAG TPA: hypothetical protein VMV58_03255 [Desulfosporosinus sp.]|nr:hypothetical protein [Desulfosporosinus sp.]